MYLFEFPSRMCEFQSAPWLCWYLVLSVFIFNHSSKCVGVSHCGFGLYFPNDWWCWTSFHVHICHSCIFFCKVSVQNYCTFFLLGCLSFTELYVFFIMDILLFSNMTFAPILWLLFYFLNGEEQNFVRKATFIIFLFFYDSCVLVSHVKVFA